MRMGTVLYLKLALPSIHYPVYVDPLSVACCLLPAACYLLPFTCCLLPAPCSLVFAACGLQSIVFGPLPATYCCSLHLLALERNIRCG
jgi:hypothetical protein